MGELCPNEPSETCRRPIEKKSNTFPLKGLNQTAGGVEQRLCRRAADYWDCIAATEHGEGDVSRVTDDKGAELTVNRC